MAVITGDPVADAILSGRNTGAAIQLLNRLLREGVIAEDSFGGILNFIIQQRNFTSAQERGERISGQQEIFAQQRIGEQGRFDERQENLERFFGSGGFNRLADLRAPVRRLQARQERQFLREQPSAFDVGETFLRDFGGSSNLQRFGRNILPGLVRQFEQEQPGARDAFLAGQVVRPGETGRQQTAREGRATQGDPFANFLKQFPFAEQFLSLAPEQRGREARRFAPRTRRLTF